MTFCIYLQKWVLKGVPKLKISTTLIAINSHVFRLATSKVELFQNSLTTYLFHNVFLCILDDTGRFQLFVFAHEKHPCRRPEPDQQNRKVNFLLPVLSSIVVQSKQSFFSRFQYSDAQCAFSKRKFDVTLTLLTTLRTRYTSRKETFWFAGYCKTGIAK